MARPEYFTIFRTETCLVIMILYYYLHYAACFALLDCPCQFCSQLRDAITGISTWNQYEQITGKYTVSRQLLPSKNSIVVLEVDTGNFVFRIYQPKDDYELTDCLREITQYYNYYDENKAKDRTGRIIRIICWPDVHGSKVLKLKDLILSQVPISEQLYLINSTDCCISCGIYEIYSLYHSLVLQRVIFGSAGRYELHSLASEFAQLIPRRGDLMGLRLKLVSMPDPDYKEVLHIEQSPQGKVEFTGGVFLMLIEDLQNMLNFTYKAVMGSTWITGMIENGTKLDGIGQQLMDYDADICVAASFINSMRAALLYFPPAVQHKVPSLFYVERTSLTSRYNILTPFSTRLWMAILVTWFFMFIAIDCILRVRASKVGGSDNVKEVSISSSLVLIQLASAVTSQGWTIKSYRVSFRIALIIALSLCSYIYSCYCATFVAKLSVPRKLIHKYEDLNSYGYIVFTNPIYRHHTFGFIMTAAEDKEIIRNSLKLWGNSSLAVGRIFNSAEKVAIATNSIHFYRAALKNGIKERRLCEISYLVNPGNRRLQEAMLMRIGSPLRELFTQRTTALIERGYIDRYNRHYNRYSHVNCGESIIRNGKGHLEVAVGECIIAFGILLFGVCAATVIIIIERLKISGRHQIYATTS